MPDQYHPVKFSPLWYQNLWIYIKSNFPTSLSQFRGMHLLPVGDVTVCKLDKSCPVILHTVLAYGLSLPTAVVSFLASVKVVVIQSMPSNHNDIWQYISRPNVEGLMKCLSMVGLSDCQTILRELDNQSLSEIRKYLADGVSSLGKSELDLLSKLPLFNLLNQNKRHCSATEVNVVAPFDSVPYKVHYNILSKADSSTVKLTKHLKMDLQSEARFFKEIIFPDIGNQRYSRNEISVIMRETLMIYHLLCSQDSSLSVQMRQIPFVETRSREFMRPCEVYDCSDPVLVTLFDRVGHLPCDNMFTEDTLQKLKLIGLKGRDDVSITDIIEVAQFIAKTAEKSADSTEQSDDMQLQTKANKTVAFLCNHRKILQSDSSSLKNLMQVPWLPVARQPPKEYPQCLEWKGSKEFYYSPSKMCRSSENMLLGSVDVFADIPSDYIRTIEDAMIAKKPEICDVVSHFAKLTQAQIGEDDIMGVKSMLTHIYNYFTKQNATSVQTAIRTQGIQSPIWVGHKFVSVDRVSVEKPPLDLEPYMYYIPRELTKFKNLFLVLGARKAQEISYVAILEEIAQKNFQKKHISERDTLLAVQILNHLPTNIPDTVPVPATSNSGSELQLVPRKLVCYGELEYKEFPDLTTEDGTPMHLLHTGVPHETAKRLEIPHWRNAMLCPDELEGFGQGEPLTTRLRNLLDDYSDGFAVLKEIIQNADDAGATEVRFLYDERKNENHRQSLFDPGMKELQGPALFAYNDAAFSDKDFENIIKLGGATKKEDTEKVGRFGLGFNAVYNLTDAPSFYSNDYLVVFDPHLKHLGNAVRGNGTPGIRINLKTKRQQVNKFTDQYYPFQDIFGCQITAERTPFQGTLFRLPLRTESQARESEICKNHYSRTEIIGLLQVLVQNRDSLLLFLQHVKKISIYHLAETAKNACDMELLCCFSIQCAGIDSDINFLSLAQKYMSPSHNGVTDSPATCAVISVDSTITKKGRRLLSYKKKTCSKWLVSQAVGIDEAYSLAKADGSTRKQALRLLPVGGVAVPLTTRQSAIIPTKLEQSRLYCFLPLPSSDGIPLPVHVNGYFSVSSDRRHLYEQDTSDKHDPKAAWNVALMKDPVSGSYINLVTHITETTSSESLTSEEYYNIWPVARAQPQGLMGHLSTSFMKKVCCDLGPKLFKGSHGWFSMEQCIFPDTEIIQSTVCSIIEDTVNLIMGEGRKLLVLPDHVLASVKVFLSSTGHTDRVLQMNKLFQEIILPNVATVHPENRDKLILFALMHTSIRDLLRDVSCIPVTPDGSTLKKPTELIHPSGPLATLYSPEEGMYPCFPNIASNHLIDIHHNLCQIGMRNDMIPWQQVAERCKSVARVTVRSNRLERAKTLVKLMNQKIESSLRSNGENLEDDVVDEIRTARFLPVLQPVNQPLPWGGEGCEYGVMSPCDAYPSKYVDLVGSVVPLLDEAALIHSWTPVASVLRCTNEPNMKLVKIQIRNAMDTTKVDTLSNSSLKKLEEIFEALYTWLNHQVGVDKITEDDISFLRQSDCLYIESNLYSPAICCKHGDSCPPYFQVLPLTKAKRYSYLWDAIGVQDNFGVQDLIKFLAEIHRSEQRPKDIDAGVKVAKMLAKRMKVDNHNYLNVQEEYGDIFAPSHEGKMTLTCDMCFNNCPWLTDIADKLFCDTNIPFEDAERIGVKTVRASVLEDYSSPMGECFGQNEPLTQRIHRLLEGYPLGKGIIYELLQNADDAGATEVHFVLDKRHHSKHRVFDKCWEPLQGPSLCVYNNKPFTQKDIEGIQHLGMGSKVTDPTKTGQYGVGFNCTYHLTDTPTILTDVVGKEKTLCVCDPHFAYVPGATMQYPGRLFKKIDELQQKFPDVFVAYLPKWFSVKDATIFRFPLRTKEQAAKSDISTKDVPAEKIEEIFQSFQENGGLSLLFLNNITSVKISVISKEGYFRNLNCVALELTGQEAKKRLSFIPQLRQAARKVKAGNVQKVDPVTVDYSLTLKNGNETEEWLVVQTLGFTADTEVDDIINSTFRKQEMCLLPRGGVAVPRGRPLKEGSVFSILPLPISSNAPAHINGHFALSYENRDNLAQITHEGVHTAWNRLLFKDVICRAYLALLENVRNSTNREPLDYYHGLLPKDTAFAKDQYMSELFISMYHTLTEKCVKCLPVLVPSGTKGHGIKWYSPVSDDFHRQPYFNTLPQQYREENQQSYLTSLASYIRVTTDKKIESILRDLGFPLLACPLWLSNAFVNSGVNIPQVSPKSVGAFLHRFEDAHSTCLIHSLDIHVTRSPFRSLDSVRLILSYCMKSDQVKLHKLPLLVTEDNTLKRFDQTNPVILSEFADLFPNFRQYFLHRQFNHLLACPVSEESVVKDFSLKKMIWMLEQVLPRDTFTGQKAIPISTLATLGGRNLPESWLAMMWNYLLSKVAGTLGEKYTSADGKDCLSVLNSLLTWNLLPVTTSDGHVYLIQVCDVGTVMDFDIGDTTSRPLRDILSELPFARLKLPNLCDYVSKSAMYKLFYKLLGNIDKPHSLVKAFGKMSQKDLGKLKSLSTYNAVQILHYLSDNLGHIKNTPNHIEILQQLPIYEDKAKQLVSLQGNACYMISSDIPNTELDIFQSRAAIFLPMPTKNNDYALYKYIGVVDMPEVEFYTKFCLLDVHFTQMMLDHGRFVHLMYLRKQLHSSYRKGTVEYSVLVECLQKLAFI